MKKNLLLSCCCAILLIFSYPNFNYLFLVWVALVPFFFLVDGKSPKAAFFWGWLMGFLFFLGTHYWLIHVTLPGMVLVNMYLGVYFGLFGLGYVFFQKLPFKHKLWVLPSLWVVLEFTRDRLFTGFGWACLGHSQYQVLPLIQIADIAGVFGVSFLVVMVNVLVKNFLEFPPLAGTGLSPSLKKEGKSFPGFVPVIKKVGDVPTYCVAAVIVAVVGYGFFKIKQEALPKSEESFSIAVIQPNIPQSLKWAPESWPVTQKKILNLTQTALKQKPDLVIWPEASFPGFVWESPERYEQIRKFVAASKVPLLLGTLTQPKPGQYYNTAMLLSTEGEETAHYDKMHLVPFGEFLPLRPILGWIRDFAPIGDDFSSGRRLTVFPQGFSTLICFEDTVAPVVRKLVNQGPYFLVNITNDGWFKDTNAPYLHLQGSVFQAVANRRAIVRAANTGVSGTISSAGMIDILKNDKGKAVMIEGTYSGSVRKNDRRSFYTRFGDVFAYLCFFVVVMALTKRKIWL